MNVHKKHEQENSFQSHSVEDIKIMLAGIDSRSIRPMRSILAGTATEEDRKELAALENFARDLREEAANRFQDHVTCSSKPS